MAKKCILTTYAGSLPRPAKLVELYAARAGGATIDEAVLIRKGEAATRWVVDRQREAGVDIPSDGEQLREAFFLYVQRRMTGFSRKWKRPHGDELASYPEYADLRRRQIADSPLVNFTSPMATGPVTYADTDANEAELSTFADA